MAGLLGRTHKGILSKKKIIPVLLDGMGMGTASGTEVNAPSFWLPLNDLGSGEVNLNPSIARGSNTPTFTRATSATTIDATGRVIEVASGVARSYYDPTSLAYRGYLTEGGRTNLCLQSGDFTNAAWGKGGTATAVLAGTYAGLPFARITPGGAGNVTQTVTFTGDGVKAISFFVKADGSNGIYPVALFDTSAAAYRLRVTITITGSVVTAAIVGGIGTLLRTTELADGVYRIECVTTAVTAANTNSFFAYDGAGTVVSLLQTGAQAENASFPSSYIPTTTATVTRNADALTYPTTGNLQASSGAVCAEIYQEGIINLGRAYGPYFTSTIDGATELGLRVGDSGNIYPIFVWGNGATANSIQGTSFANDYLLHKMAATWGTIAAIAHDGTLDGSIGMTNGIVLNANMYLGFNGDGNFPMFGTIKNVRLWTNEKSTQYLQQITT